MRKTLLSLLVVAALAVMAGAASAQATFIGSLNWPGCITASEDWAGEGTEISWTITQAMAGGPWSYEYTLAVADNPDISHWILELTPGLVLDPEDVDWPEDDLEYNDWGPSQSNPGFPEGCDFYGVKFDDVQEEEELTYTFTFTTDRAPVWGDFYAKGGKDQFMYNSGICYPDPSDPPKSEPIGCKILRPDTDGVIIPEPSSVALAMMGALPIIGFRLRRKQ